MLDRSKCRRIPDIPENEGDFLQEALFVQQSVKDGHVMTSFNENVREAPADISCATYDEYITHSPKFLPSSSTIQATVTVVSLDACTGIPPQSPRANGSESTRE